MRIAIISARSPLAAAGGNGQLTRPASLARALAGLGHRVTIYARAEDSSSPGTAILGHGVSVEHIPAGPARQLTAEEAARHMPALARQLAERWQTRPPDVVHAFGWTSGLAAFGATRGTGIPLLQCFESLGSAEHRQAGRTDVAACRVTLEAAIGRVADAVLASSAAEARELGRLAVPRSAIRVVPIGVDTSLFRPDAERVTKAPRAKRAKAEVGKTESARPARLIAFADSQVRGLQAIVRALTQLPRVELVVVGGPDARHLPRSGPFRELAQLATELRVRSRVTFAGEVGQAELPALLRSCDVMVSAARYEPSGAAAIQAMACGVPVVVPAVGGNADAVVDGITGLLVTPEHPGMLAHRVRALLARPALRQAYGIAAADRARSRYSFDRIGQETVAAYESCLQARSAATASPSLDDEMAALERTVDLFDLELRDMDLSQLDLSQLDLRAVAALA